MGNPSDQISTANLTDSGAQELVALKDEILLTWEERVRKFVPLAERLSEPILMDTLPVFLANLAQAISNQHPRTLATESNNVAEEHGGERARVTRYGPEQVIKEYQILRDVVFEKLTAKCALTDSQISVIIRSFDQGIQDAMTAFFLVHGRLREQFIATLSHDLRNPLTAAKMSMDQISKDLARSGDSIKREKLKNIAERAAKNIKRADLMIQNLLDSSALQLGERLILNLAEYDIKAIAESVLSELTEDQRPRTSLIGSNTKGYWDRDLIWRALENLVGNAFKYGADNSPVTIRVYEKLGRVMISVHNEGTPIPVDELEMLFQPFRRSEAARKGGKQGWGIGLAQVRGVTEAHGGSLAVDSSVGSGTTFTMDLPIDARPLQC